ncbi:MAG: tRNA (adenosine(37)-N6)-threonylcarbamoyltransferase complex dimerization subunit type 1 TsaB [Allosphingosinicella sp.]
MQLVIESASGVCSAALLDARDQLLDKRHEVVGRGHAERLVPMIAELLAGRRPSTILVDCGPGSFTGVRVGLAAAHGLAIGWGVDLSGFSSLALLAAASGEEEVAIALQAGHGELFVQTYGGDPLIALDDLRSLPPQAAGSHIRSERVIGSGSQALVEARGSGRWSDASLRAADARLLPEALRRLPARPIYGRAPDAKPMA